MRDIKRLVLLLLFAFFLSVPMEVVGQQNIIERDSTESAQVVEKVNSFDLFWPLAPGKTMADGLYPLKRFKEKLRGLFIFAPGPKADYSVFLASKRVLEAEKLLAENKVELATRTLQDATGELDNADRNLSMIVSQGKKLGASGGTITNRLDAIAKLTTWLGQQHKTSQEPLEKVKEKAEALKNRI